MHARASDTHPFGTPENCRVKQVRTRSSRSKSTEEARGCAHSTKRCASGDAAPSCKKRNKTSRAVHVTTSPNGGPDHPSVTDPTSSSSAPNSTVRDTEAESGEGISSHGRCASSRVAGRASVCFIHSSAAPHSTHGTSARRAAHHRRRTLQSGARFALGERKTCRHLLTEGLLDQLLGHLAVHEDESVGRTVVSLVIRAHVTVADALNVGRLADVEISGYTRCIWGVNYSRTTYFC